MLEMLDDLKNNKKRIIKDASVLVDSWKKVLLNTLKQKGIFRLRDPLQITLQDALSDDFLFQWRKSPASEDTCSTVSMTTCVGRSETTSRGKKSLESVLGINTLLRRRIFEAISSSSDVLDAVEKLGTFKSSSERREIPHIILLCAKKENPYNPFYAHLSSTLIQQVDGLDAVITLMYALWDFSRSLSGKISIKELSNVAFFYAHLLSNSSLSFSALKVELLHFFTLGN